MSRGVYVYVYIYFFYQREQFYTSSWLLFSLFSVNYFFVGQKATEIFNSLVEAMTGHRKSARERESKRGGRGREGGREWEREIKMKTFLIHEHSLSDFCTDVAFSLRFFLRRCWVINLLYLHTILPLGISMLTCSLCAIAFIVNFRGWGWGSPNFIINNLAVINALVQLIESHDHGAVAIAPWFCWRLLMELISKAIVVKGHGVVNASTSKALEIQDL